ncbi:MAG: hypothetical protein GY760_17965 [Deltaproteobacteria bacterium]|nr:hypothetical protein [Deltaproteobacteria bacterium]
MRFGILRKILIIFLIISLIPSVLLSIYALKKLSESGQEIVETSRETIILNSTPLIESRAKSIASKIELLLEKCLDDINLLSTLPQSRYYHKKFYKIKKGRIWIREGKKDDYVEISKKIPLYSEMTFINKEGLMLFHTGMKRRKSKILLKPFITNYGQENYFQEALKLKGKVFVGRVTGLHIRKEDQLNGAKSVEKAIGGTEYSGIIRFAKAIFRKGELAGVVSLALDHRHLMEFTQHIVPLEKEEIVFPRYNEGNYAFAFDDQGWVITHPRFWYIRGFDDKTGMLFNSDAGTFNEEKLHKGLIPFNLTHTLTDYSSIVKKILNGHSGIIQIKNEKNQRTISFAPIKFNSGIFGGVVLEIKNDVYNHAVSSINNEFRNFKGELTNIFLILISITGIIVSLFSFILSKKINKIIFRISKKANDIKNGDYSTKLNINSGDEFESLADSISKMGYEMLQNEEKLLKSSKNIEKDRDGIRKEFDQLQKHIDILKNIHSERDFFNNSQSFDTEYVYETILRNSVDIIGFERAELYLLDNSKENLSCVKEYGSIKDELTGSKFSLDDNSLQTNVIKSGDSLFVRDINLINIEEKIIVKSKRENSYSFAMIPLFISGENTGLLVIDHITTKRSISLTEEKLIKILARESAIAIEKANLIDKHFKRSYRYGSLGLLAEGVAHEIRKPLKDITLILNDLHNNFGESSLIQNALGEIDFMANIVSNLVDFAKRKDADLIEKEVNDIVEQALDIFKSQSIEDIIIVSFNLMPEKIMVLVDSIIFVQGLAEIIVGSMGNSSSSELNIKTAYQTLSDSHKNIIISVNDSNSNLKGGNFTYNPFFSNNLNGFYKTEDVEGEIKISLSVIDF